METEISFLWYFPNGTENFDYKFKPGSFYFSYGYWLNSNKEF